MRTIMKKITREELKEMMDKDEDFDLINVLPENSFRIRHIPRSINIPVQNPNFIESAADKIPIKDRTIIVYCASIESSASQTATEKLRKMGYKNIYYFEGGLKDWEEANYPMESSLK